MARVTLSKKELATSSGGELLKLLQEITHDGELSLDEINRMKVWLDQHSETTTVPAVAWLREILKAMLADGRITPAERQELLLAIERVLPQDERILAKVRRKAAAELSQGGEEEEEPEDEVDDTPATPRQIEYLRSLRVSFDERKLTKDLASSLITEALEGRAQASNRQIMVLRFWSRTDLAKLDRREISEWMDEWYEAEPLRLEAWELWKSESNDDGSQGDPTVVPVGIGEKYLERVRRGREVPAFADRDHGAMAGLVVAIVIAVIGLASYLMYGR